MEIDIKHGDIDIKVGGQLVLHIGQVSDEDTINLFMYPEGSGLVESIIHKHDPTESCTHEILVPRRKKD